MLYLLFKILFELISVDIFCIERYWQVYKKTSIKPYPQNPPTYLLVHHPDDNQSRLFKNVPSGSHAEENFMNAYREEGQEAIKLDIYLTFAPCGIQGHNCAEQLRDFAGEFKLELNIKAVGPYYRNEEELNGLMTSEYCTVEAFTEEDHRHLAEYLGFPDNWEYTQNMIDRDHETQHRLRGIADITLM